MSNEFIDRMKDVAGHLTEAQRLLSKGPLDFYFAKLVEHSEALLTKFAPFKVGDRVCIMGQVPCPGGWAHYAKSLEPGALGTVSGVDYLGEDFLIDFTPDRQFYGSGDRWVEMEGSTNYYPLPARYLAEIRD